MEPNKNNSVGFFSAAEQFFHYIAATALSPEYASMEQKKDEAFMLTFETWDHIQHADSSLLNNETFLFKALYMTNDPRCATLIPSLKNSLQKESIEAAIKHLLLNDPQFLLNYIKKNGNNYPKIRLPETELMIACMKHDELLELVELDRPKVTRKQFGMPAQKIEMSRDFWIPLAAKSDKAVACWISENKELTTSAELIYVTIKDTKNFFFFEQAEENVKKDIITIANYYQDLTFTKKILNTIEEPSNQKLSDILPLDIIDRILSLVPLLFIQDLNELITDHGKKKIATRKKPQELSNIAMVCQEKLKTNFNPKKMATLNEIIFSTKIELIRIAKRAFLIDIEKGFFKDIKAIQTIYAKNYLFYSSPLELRYLGQTDNDKIEPMCEDSSLNKNLREYLWK